MMGWDDESENRLGWVCLCLSVCVSEMAMDDYSCGCVCMDYNVCIIVYCRCWSVCILVGDSGSLDS